MGAIFRREFKAYFHSMTGYVFTFIFLIASGIFITAYNLVYSSASISPVLSNLSLVFALVIPVLTMGIFSSEKKGGTYTLLCSLPLKSSEIVLGKYFALLALIAIPTAVVGVAPLILRIFGDVNFLSSYASLLGFFLICAALSSICLFISSLSDSNVINAVTGYAVTVILYILNVITVIIPKSSPWAKIVSTLSLFGGFDAFSVQLFDLRAIVYFICIIITFTFLTVRSVEKRRV